MHMLIVRWGCLNDSTPLCATTAVFLHAKRDKPRAKHLRELALSCSSLRPSHPLFHVGNFGLNYSKRHPQADRLFLWSAEWCESCKHDGNHPHHPIKGSPLSVPYNGTVPCDLLKHFLYSIGLTGRAAFNQFNCSGVTFVFQC